MPDYIGEMPEDFNPEDHKGGNPDYTLPDFELRDELSFRDIHKNSNYSIKLTKSHRK